MANDLIEIGERIQFARDEIEKLDQEIAAFFNEAASSWTEPNPGSAGVSSYDIVVKIIHPVPVRLRARAGTIANELRSCLDALACQLAIRNGETPKDVYFPISKSKAIFEQDGLRKIRKLSSAHQAIIIGLAPYREANPVLFGLHEADRTRKHQKLAAAAASNPSAGFSTLVRSKGEGSIIFKNCQINGIVLDNVHLQSGGNALPIGREVRLASGVPDGLPFSFDFALTYQDPPELAGQSVVECLQRFATTVGEILQRFA